MMFYFQASTTPSYTAQKHSLIPITELERRFDSAESLRCSSPGDSYVCFRHLGEQGTYDVLTLKCSLLFKHFVHILYYFINLVNGSVYLKQTNNMSTWTM